MVPCAGPESGPGPRRDGLRGPPRRRREARLLSKHHGRAQPPCVHAGGLRAGAVARQRHAPATHARLPQSLGRQADRDAPQQSGLRPHTARHPPGRPTPIPELLVAQSRSRNSRPNPPARSDTPRRTGGRSPGGWRVPFNDFFFNPSLNPQPHPL